MTRTQPKILPSTGALLKDKEFVQILILHEVPLNKHEYLNSILRWFHVILFLMPLRLELRETGCIYFAAAILKEGVQNTSVPETGTVHVSDNQQQLL